jgi:hypothetical protein
MRQPDGKRGYGILDVNSGLNPPRFNELVEDHQPASRKLFPPILPNTTHWLCKHNSTTGAWGISINCLWVDDTLNTTELPQ